MKLVLVLLGILMVPGQTEKLWQHSELFRLKERTIGDTTYNCTLEVFADRRVEIIIRTKTAEITKVMMGEKEVEFQAKGKHFQVQLLANGQVSETAPFLRTTVGYTKEGSQYSNRRDGPGRRPPPDSIKEVIETLRPFEESIKKECGKKVHRTIFTNR